MVHTIGPGRQLDRKSSRYSIAGAAPAVECVSSRLELPRGFSADDSCTVNRIARLKKWKRPGLEAGQERRAHARIRGNSPRFPRRLIEGVTADSLVPLFSLFPGSCENGLLVYYSWRCEALLCWRWSSTSMESQDMRCYQFFIVTWIREVHLDNRLSSTGLLLSE